jgi:hypothetical protein
LPKFPEPPDPAELARLAPAALAVVGPERLLWRVYFRAGRRPTLWNRFRFVGPTGSRFDDHLPAPDGSPREQDRGILYAASAGRTCLAEVFQDTRTIDRARALPWLVAFRPLRALRLLDLTGTWPTRAGASTAIGSGVRARARRWSQVVQLAFPELDGLLYASSMDGHAPAMALYERAADAMPPQPAFHRALDDPAIDVVTRNAAHDLNYRLV